MPALNLRPRTTLLVAGIVTTVLTTLLWLPNIEAQPNSPVTSSFDTARATFERGEVLFDEARRYQQEHPASGAEIQERYRRAGDEFQSAWQAGGATTEVFTNAGNSYAFAGDHGKAILFYRRALSVNPANQVATNGLASLRETLPIREPRASAADSLARTLFFWHEGLAFRTRWFAFFLLFPISFLALTIALWRRRPFRLIGFVLLVPAVALLVSIVVDAYAASLMSDGVIQVEVVGRRGDGESYGPSHSMPFPPGTEVTVLEAARTSSDDGAAWVSVRLLDGSSTWIPQRAMDPVLVSAQSDGLTTSISQ